MEALIIAIEGGFWGSLTFVEGEAVFLHPGRSKSSPHDVLISWHIVGREYAIDVIQETALALSGC